MSISIYVYVYKTTYQILKQSNKDLFLINHLKNQMFVYVAV